VAGEPGVVLIVLSARSRDVLSAAWKGSLVTDTTLTRVFRRHRGTVPAARLVVRWDRETGWAHLAVAGPGTGRARFAGFHRFSGGGSDAVAAELAAAGCVTAPPSRVDDHLMEIEAVLVCREVAADAVR
jgi:hypothetical protein